MLSQKRVADAGRRPVGLFCLCRRCLPFVLGGKDSGGGVGKGEGSNRKELDHDDGMIWKIEFSFWQRAELAERCWGAISNFRVAESRVGRRALGDLLGGASRI